MLDYLAVKKFHAVKLAEDAAGDGRVESAFYHTVKMVYLKGIEERGEIGILDGRSNPLPITDQAFIALWLITDTHFSGMTSEQYRKLKQLCETFYRAGKKHKEKALLNKSHNQGEVK